MERRRLLAATAAAFVRQRVYRVPEGLEIDETEHFEVVRRRVFFDEVFLVTLHVRTGIVSLVLTGTFGLLLGVSRPGSGGARRKEPARSSSHPVRDRPGLRFAPRSPRCRVVTVQGRRGRATLLFPFRRGKARRIYDEICRDVAAAQRTNQVSLERTRASRPGSRHRCRRATRHPDAGRLAVGARVDATEFDTQTSSDERDHAVAPDEPRLALEPTIVTILIPSPRGWLPAEVVRLFVPANERGRTRRSRPRPNPWRS